MSIIGRNYRNRRPDGEDTITLTNEVQQVREGDYVSEEDGLLYCGKCGRPKQVRITVNGTEKVQNCRCGCAEEGKGAEEYDEPPIPGKLRRYPLCTFRHCREEEPSITEAYFRTYVRLWESVSEHGLGLLLTGGADSGKTFYAACIGNALKERGVSVTMVPVSEMTQVMRALDGDRQSRVRRTLEQEDLLILDDLWMESLDPWDTEFLLAVLSSREMNRRPTIITSRQELEHYVPEGPGGARRLQLAKLIDKTFHFPMTEGAAGWKRKWELRDVQMELMERWHEELRDEEEEDEDAG